MGLTFRLLEELGTLNQPAKGGISPLSGSRRKSGLWTLREARALG